MPVYLVPTEDGSPTCRDSETGELYHNSAGAYLEALTNYVRPALANLHARPTKAIKVIDICFGLGYNAFSFLNELLNVDLVDRISIVAVDRDPKILEAALTVLSLPSFALLESCIPMMETCFAQQETIRKTSFELRRVDGGKLSVEFLLYVDDLRIVVPSMASLEDSAYFAIFHDGFSPAKVPELWTIDLFNCFCTLLDKRRGAILTYSGSPAVRGAFQELDLKVTRTPALGRKQGGTMASFIELPGGVLLSAEEQAKLLTASALPYRDSDFKLSRKEIQDRRLTEQSAFKSQH